MAGLWEGVPASPCSAASDEAPMRSTRQAAVHATRFSKLTQAVSPLSDAHLTVPKRSLTEPAPRDMSPPPPLKRSRSEASESPQPMDVERPSASSSGPIEFVEAKKSKAEPTSNFVAHLNFSAADERRKQLLQRLRDIDAKKAQLASSSPLASQHVSPVPEDDEVIIVEDKSSVASPSDVQAVPEAVPSNTRNMRRRKPRPPPRKKATRGKKASAAPVQVIDLDAESSAMLDIPKPSAAPKRAKKATKSVPKPTAPVLPQRTSSRVRRPRTKSVDRMDSGDPRAGPTPTCMSKCKRFQFCKKLITSLLRNSSAGPFSAPVNELWHAEAIPRYFDVITRPMDLRTVKKNLETSVYISPITNGMLPYHFEVEKFADDVRQVFRNAMVYNGVGDMLYNCAKALMEDFEKTLNEQLPDPPTAEEIAQCLSRKRSAGKKSRKDRRMQADTARAKNVSTADSGFADARSMVQIAATARPSKKDSWSAAVTRKEESETSDMVLATRDEMQDRLAYLRNCRSAVLARTPVPKGSGYLTRAALLYDVEISFQQKLRCSSAIEDGKVPAGKLESLVDLVKKSTGMGLGAAADDEFEFEFDKLDNKAWRNIEAFLEQYVPGFKTIRSSVLGREFSSINDVDEEIRSIESRLADSNEPKRKVTRVAEKPRSFFGCGEAGDEDDSSSDSSGDDSDSDSSDSDSDCE